MPRWNEASQESSDLHVRVVGREAPGVPSICFLHGGGASGWSWDPVIERLCDDFHCLIPDLPEHGRSAGVRPFTIDDAAQRVAALLGEQAHGGRAHLVGLSLGAQVGLTLLGVAPERVERAMLSGTLVRPVRGASLIQPLLRLYAPFQNLELLVRANMRAYNIPEAYFAAFRADTRLMSAQVLGRVLEANLTFRMPRGLAQAKVQTLVVVGEREPATVRESTRDIVAALPMAEARIVRGVGHNWSLEAPDLFAETVRAWISGGPLPEGLVPLTA